MLQPRGAVESNHQVEGDLRRLEAMNIKQLTLALTGSSSSHGLPVRGSEPAPVRTRRGRRQTVAGKKKAPAVSNYYPIRGVPACVRRCYTFAPCCKAKQ